MATNQPNIAATGTVPNPQGFTTAQQMSAYSDQLKAQQDTQKKEADIQSAIASRPQGTVYDPSTNTYRDPLTGMSYSGSAVTTGMGKMGAGQPGITQETKPVSGAVLPGQGLRFSTGTSGTVVTPTNPNLTATGTGTPTPTFTDSRLAAPSATEQTPTQPGTLSSATARQESADIASSLKTDQSTTSQFYQQLLDRMDKRAQEDRANLQQQQQAAERSLRQQQERETATAQAVQFRLGRSDTAQGTADMQYLAQQQRAEVEASNMKYQNLIQQSQRALEDGQVSLAKDYRQQAMQEAQFAMQRDQFLLTQQKEQSELAQKNLDDIAKSGVMPSEDWLNSQDKANNRASGTTKGLIQASIDKQALDNKAKSLENAKTQMEVDQLTKELKDDSYTQLKKIQDLRKSHPYGEAFSFGGNTYYGTDMSTVEVSKEDGVARQLYVDGNGQPRIRVLGQLNTADSAQMEHVYVNGVLITRNKKTGQMVSTNMPNANGEVSVDTVFPVGTKGGQCGAAMHSVFTDYPYGLDTVEQKKAAINVPQGETPSAGMQFFQNIGPNGHTGIVTWTGVDPNTGRQIMKVCESNYNGDEKWGTRMIYADDPTIMGYRKGAMNPVVSRALGIAETQDGSISAPTQEQFITKTPSGNLVKTASPFVTGTQTESQYQASLQKENQAQVYADQLVSGDRELKDIPAEVSGRALQIAKENGYLRPGEQRETMGFTEWADKKGITMSSPDMIKEFQNYQQITPNIQSAIDNQAGVITPQRLATIRNSVSKSLDKGDVPRAVNDLITSSMNASGADTKKQWSGATKLQTSLKNLKEDLNEYVKEKGDTGILRGSWESLKNKAGTTGDPKLVAIKNAIQMAINSYRLTVTGAAFTASEGELYDQMFPSITGQNRLNMAKIEGLESGNETNKEALERSVLGDQFYDSVMFPMRVKDKTTGQTGTISAYEFDSNKFSAL